MSTAMHEWPRRHRISVEHFHRMSEAGLFDEDERVELVNGEIIDVPPIGSRHAGTLHRLAAMLSTALSTRALVRQQLPLRLSEDSEPLPDIAVVKPRSDDYIRSHPTGADCLLVIEISDSTLRYDRDVKTVLYAEAAVPEVWILDVQGSRAHVFREPADGVYTEATATAFQLLAIAAFPGVDIDLARLHV